MKLKYERQWETIEKIFEKEKFKIYAQSGYFYSLTWETKMLIIQSTFNVNQYIDWNKLWAIFENDIDVLHLEDWEHQQKPLLDKMIELILWNKDI